MIYAMTAIYKIKPLNTPFSALVEIKTGVVIHIGTDCAEYAQRFGLNLVL